MIIPTLPASVIGHVTYRFRLGSNIAFADMLWLIQLLKAMNAPEMQLALRGKHLLDGESLKCVGPPPLKRKSVPSGGKETIPFERSYIP